jgi:hypothetical protein
MKAPWVLPADKMKDGDHTLRIYYTVPAAWGQAGEKYPARIKDQGGRIASHPGPARRHGRSLRLWILDMPATASRPAPDVVGGVSTPEIPFPSDSIQTLPTFPPARSTSCTWTEIPSNPRPICPADRRTDLTLPATVGDGPHQVEAPRQPPRQPEVRFPPAR